MQAFSFNDLLKLITGNHGLPARAAGRVKRPDGEEELAPATDDAPAEPGQTLSDVGAPTGEPIQLAQAEAGAATEAAGGASASAGTAGASAGAATGAAAGAGIGAAAGGLGLGALAAGGLGLVAVAGAAGGGKENSASSTSDTSAPTATLTAASIANNGNATVQSSETGTAYLVKNTLTVGTLADITGAADNQWNSVAITTANSDTNLSVAGLQAGVYKLYTADAAGNLSAVAGKTAVVTNTTNANSIDLTDAGVAGDEGNLIAPVYVDGNWYFHWDRSGDGSSANSGALNSGNDFTSHNILDGIFTRDVNGNANPGTDTDNSYRYATLNGVKLALPVQGDGGGVTGVRPGTAIDNSPAGETNPTYDDLLAIWDAHNGAGTETSVGGTPAGWQANQYWSATSVTGGHAIVNLNLGSVSGGTDGGGAYVALQVL